MKVLIAYASTEGQTRKIAQRLADHIVDGGRTVELVELSTATRMDLQRFDGVILAASVHVGHYQRALTNFVAERSKDLQAKSTLFLSVSLAAAGHEAEDWKTLDKIKDEFVEATGWVPSRVEQVAGAYLPSEYDIFRRFIMRRILASKNPEADLDADKEYTDWNSLFRTTDDWLAGIDATD
jgi:menaquinone-dependent protoporphyrinogen oxidase